jgi:phytoene synthase
VTAETRKRASRSSAEQGGASLRAMLRQHDRDRYQTVLFAPVERRDALFALYAFNYEIARVRESVTQPMLGQIRLQWWREVIDAAYAGAVPRQHEVALPLTEAIQERSLSRASFDRLIDARECDLTDEPPADMAALVDYAEGTSAALQALVLQALGINEAASGAAARAVGIGYALAGLLRAMPFHAASGRCYIPAAIAAECGLDPADYQRLHGSEGIRGAALVIADAAAAFLGEARRQRGIPRAALAALLPAVIARRYLRRLRQARFDPFAPALRVPDTLQSWRLSTAAMTGRF